MRKLARDPRFVAVMGLLVLSTSVSGEVFKCVDKTTGKLTFTDRACPDKGFGDYVPVGPANTVEGDKSSQSEYRRDSQSRPSPSRGSTRVANGGAGGSSSSECQQARKMVDKYTKEAERHRRSAETSHQTIRRSALQEADAAERSADRYASICTGEPIQRAAQNSGAGPAPQPSPITNNAQCMGNCASEQGICISRCRGDGQCIGNCAAVHGRCVSRCN